MLKGIYLGLGLLFSPVVAGENLPVLRVPHIADAAPFMILNAQQQPTSGMLFELYQLLSDSLQVKMQIEAVPRKLVGKLLLKGEIDIYCNGTPEWFIEPELRWGPPLFIHRDLVVSRANYQDFAGFMRQARGRIGTTYEYVYPTLSWLFENGQLERVDSFSPRESLRLLQTGHLDAVIVSELEFNYFLADGAGFSSLVIEQNEIQCMYAPQLTEQQVQLLNTQLSALIKKGEIIKIIEKYQ